MYLHLLLGMAYVSVTPVLGRLGQVGPWSSLAYCFIQSVAPGSVKRLCLKN